MAFIPANIGGSASGTNLTPSNSSPAQIASGSDYHATANGYAIASYDSVTPSSTAVSVAADDIVKIGGSGVIVDSIPTPTETTLWQNSDPTANMGTKTLISNFSSMIQDYDYLKFIWHTSTTDNTEMFIIVSVTDYKATGSGDGNMITMGTKISGTRYARQVYNNAGALATNGPAKLSGSGALSSAIIITKIIGIKM